MTGPEASVEVGVEDTDAAALSHAEAALRGDEEAVEARLALVRRRRLALAELDAYVADRELTLRARLGRAGLSLRDLGVDEDAPPGSTGATELAMDGEWAAHLEARAQLLEQRRQLIARRKAAADAALAAELERERWLVARDNALTEAHRALVLRSAAGALTGDGRRQHPRIEVRLTVDVHSAHRFTPAPGVGEAQNLSVGGLFVATRDVLPLGREVRAVVRLPDTGELALDGVVAWRRVDGTPEGPAGFGLRFTALEPAARAAVERLMARRGPGGAAP